jgi:hypothetical protein
MQPITWYIYSHSCTNDPHVQPAVSHYLLTSLQLALQLAAFQRFIIRKSIDMQIWLLD